MEEKVKHQYFYKQNGCKANKATDSDCICWHDEGTGPYKEAKHDYEFTMLSWREITNPNKA